VERSRKERTEGQGQDGCMKNEKEYGKGRKNRRQGKERRGKERRDASLTWPLLIKS